MKNSILSFFKKLQKEKWLILLCLALAFVSWQAIRKNIGFEVSVSNIAVDVDVPDGWAVWEKSAHQVNIMFRGSREDIRYLNNEQMRVVIPIPDPEHGKEVAIKLSEVLLRNPSNTKAIQFSPAEVVIKLDQAATKLLPVKASLEGNPPTGLELERVECIPASVRISGAKKVLDSMDSIHTEPITLLDRTVTFKESALIALPQAGRVKSDPEWVSIKCSIAEHNSTQSFNEIPIRIVSVPNIRRRIEMMPETVNIVVQGQQRQLEKLQRSDIFAYISCHTLKSSAEYELPITIDLPDGLKLMSSTPSIVQVKIGKGN